MITPDTNTLQAILTLRRAAPGAFKQILHWLDDSDKAHVRALKSQGIDARTQGRANECDDLIAAFEGAQEKLREREKHERSPLRKSQPGTAQQPSLARR